MNLAVALLAQRLEIYKRVVTLLAGKMMRVQPALRRIPAALAKVPSPRPNHPPIHSPPSGSIRNYGPSALPRRIIHTRQCLSNLPSPLRIGRHPKPALTSGLTAFRRPPRPDLLSDRTTRARWRPSRTFQTHCPRTH